MTHCLSKNLDEIKEIQLIKENVQGFGIPAYSISVERGEGKAPYWSYKRESNLKPETVITKLLNDHDFIVMNREGGLIREVFILLQLIAYDEYHNGSMIKETKNGKKISLRQLNRTFPSAPFTLEYIKELLTSSSVDEIIEYLNIFSSITRQPYGFEDDELYIISEFLKAFTLERLLTMFELALLDSFGGLSGWPDITAIKDNGVYFIEVKTTDSLTKKQKDWLRIFKDPLDLDYRIIRLKESNKVCS